MKRIGVAVACGLLVVVGGPELAGADDDYTVLKPVVTVSPSAVARCEVTTGVVTTSVSGFLPNEVVNIAAGGASISIAVNAAGSASTTLPLPKADGTTTVTAVGVTSGSRASTQFTVVACPGSIAPQQRPPVPQSIPEAGSDPWPILRIALALTVTGAFGLVAFGSRRRAGAVAGR